MANWSETEFVVNGEDACIAYEEIKKYVDEKESFLMPTLPKKYLDEDGNFLIDPNINTLELSAGYSSMEVLEFYCAKNELVLYGNGRWCAPYLFLSDIVEKYHLTGYFTDAESGVGFFSMKEWESGKVTKDIETEYISKESVTHFGADNLAGEYDWIRDEEDWENVYSNILEDFKQAGVSKEDFMKFTS